MTRGIRLAAAMAACALLLSGCEFDGIGSVPLPFTPGTGSGSYQITVLMADLGNLVPNAEVKVDDITVGTVTKTEFENWHAKLTVGLENSVRLPENVTAVVGQKSLLGAEYLALQRPTTEPAAGTLHANDVVPLSRTGKYPETEDLLAALSALLNGGGLAQLNTIETELNHALAGRETDTRSLLADLSNFVGTLDAQRQDIVHTIDSLDHFSGTLAAQNNRLLGGIDALGPGLQALEADRPALTKTLQSLSDLGSVADRVITSTQDDLLANLRDLQPILSRIADAGDAVPLSLEEVGTFPFPIRTISNIFRGDYMNLFLTLDLTATTLDKNLLTGTLAQGLPTTLTNSLGQLLAPTTAPSQPLIPGQTPAATPAPSASPTPAPSTATPGTGGTNQDGLGGLISTLLGGGG